MSYLTLLRLREIASLKSNIIQKGKKYIKPGQKAPKGVQLHKGPQGGYFYFTKHETQLNSDMDSNDTNMPEISFDENIDIVHSHINYLQESVTNREVEEIAQDIAENGWNDDPDYPIVLVQSKKYEYTVVDGHHRIHAAKKAHEEYGWEGVISAVVIQKDAFNEIINQQYDGEVPIDNLGELAETIRTREYLQRERNK